MLILAQVDPKLVERAAVATGEQVKDNPLWVVVIALGAIVAVMLTAVIWWVRVGHPQQMAARLADRKERADRADAERKARAEEKALDRQLLKDVALASITQAQDGARATVAEITKEVGERVKDVQVEVSQAHDTSRQIHKLLAGVAGKLGVGAAFLIFTVGCGPNEFQIRSMKTWSARARTACTVSGACPAEQACVQGVVDAAQPEAGGYSTRLPASRTTSRCIPRSSTTSSLLCAPPTDQRLGLRDVPLR